MYLNFFCVRWIGFFHLHNFELSFKYTHFEENSINLIFTLFLCHALLTKVKKFSCTWLFWWLQIFRGKFVAKIQCHWKGHHRSTSCGKRGKEDLLQLLQRYHISSSGFFWQGSIQRVPTYQASALLQSQHRPCNILLYTFRH